jgi:hypothetical protein
MTATVIVNTSMTGKDVTLAKSEVEAQKEQVWEQLTNEGTSSGDSDVESSLHLSGSDTEQSAVTDCISGFVSSSTSDNEQDAPPAPSNAEPAGQEAKLMYPPGLLSPQRRTRKAPIAEVLSSKLLEASAGKPVKVWQSSDYKPMKPLDPSIPAKKKPVFKEFTGKEKTLDPTIPAKKHIPSWLLRDAFGESIVSSMPISPKPPKMPLRAAQVPQACPAPAPR